MRIQTRAESGTTLLRISYVYNTTQLYLFLYTYDIPIHTFTVYLPPMVTQVILPEYIELKRFIICVSDLQPWYSFIKDVIFLMTYELVGDKKQEKGSGHCRPWE